MAEDTVKAMVARVDERTAWIVCELKKMREAQVDHGIRIRSLETFKGWLIGVGAAIVAIVGVLVKFKW